jgi:hypothetical protein
MSLPPGIGTISDELQSSVRETINVMSTIDFHSLSPKKKIEWNVALSKTCLHFSHKVGNLYHQLSLKEHNKHTSSMHKMDEFAKFTFPLIKRVGHSTFINHFLPHGNKCCHARAVAHQKICIAITMTHTAVMLDHTPNSLHFTFVVQSTSSVSLHPC